MDLPPAALSDALVNALRAIEAQDGDWLQISAALNSYESRTKDVQAGWLMTAFDYTLARRVGAESRNLPTFAPQVSTNEFEYPTPLPVLPTEVAELWSVAADLKTGDASQARLHHLLFELRHGNPGEHGRAAATAYLSLGRGNWDRIERANCLHWSLDLSRRLKDDASAIAVHQSLVELALESMGQTESFEPGVALHAIEVLARE